VEVGKPQKGSINQLHILFVGLIIVSLSIITYFFILKGVFGDFSTDNFIPKMERTNNLLAGGKAKVAILYSNYTQNMLPQGSTWLEDNLNTWKRFLSNNGYGCTVIQDSIIEQGKHFNYDVIILMGSKSLSDKEIIQIKKYLDRGGSVFATSGTATFSEDGKWRGWEYFSQVYGLKFSKEIDNDQVIKIHTLRGQLPITANIPTGYPLKIATWDKPIACEILDPRTIQASFWYNFRLQDGLVREEIKRSAGIAYGTYNAGRFVWMGFEINSVIGVQEDYIYFDKLFKNCMSWLTYQPLAYVSEWPEGYQAAAVITPEISQEISGTENLLPILASENVKASFFIDPYIAEQNKSLVQQLSKYGEVGSLVDIGYLASVNDTVNKLNDLYTQTAKIRDAKRRIEAITKKPVQGLFPLFGLFDQMTPKALIDAGYLYVMTDSLTDRSVPKVLIRDKNRVSAMTKTARDDNEIIRDLHLTQNEFQFYTYQEDIDRILFEGGLYIMKLHPEFQCKAEHVQVVRDVIRDLKLKKFWITTADEIQKWYMKKNYVELRIERRGISRIVVVVTNPGKEVYSDLSVLVDMNDNAESIKLTSEIIGTEAPAFKYNKSDNSLYLFIKNLKAGESRTFNIDYTKTNR